MFGRNKRKRASAAAQQTSQSTENPSQDEAPAGPRALGPWDESEFTGERGEYLNMGALLVRPVSGVDVRMEVNQQTKLPQAVHLDFRDGSVQLQVFTAPKSSGLWDEVRAELVAGLRRDGGDPTVSEGPLGLQVNARFPGTTSDGREGYRLARFVGIDGPRWFLRAVFTGGAAVPGTTSEVLDDAARALVVVRGQDPHPPRDLLELTMPDGATLRRVGGQEPQPPAGSAGADGAQENAEASGPAVQAPRRGPEITEIG